MPQLYARYYREQTDLSDAQTRLITATVSDYREKLRELRAAVNRAEAGLESAFNQDPVDQKEPATRLNNWRMRSRRSSDR
jgi:hypothetical protein